MPNRLRRSIHTIATSLHSIRPHYYPLAAYLILSLLLFAPVLPDFGATLMGGPIATIDAWQNVWNLWWSHQALSHAQNPFYTTLLYHPDGVGLYLQTLNISNGVLALPVTHFFGPIAAFNTAALAGFVLAGAGAYALALYYCNNRVSAFIAGLLFTFSPFHMTKLWDGQLELISMQWLPFYVLLLLRATEQRRRSDAILAGILLALIGYTSWYYFLFLALFSVLFALLWIIPTPEQSIQGEEDHPGNPRTQVFQQLLIIGTSSVILLAPVLIPALSDVGLRGVSNADTLEDPLKLIHSADLLDFFLPSALHPVWGSLVTEFGTQLHPDVAAWNIAPGYVALILAVSGAFVYRRANWRWLVLVCAGIVLALGPQLHVDGQNTGVPLPYLLLSRLPGVGAANRPNHMIVITLIAMVPLVGVGMRWLLEHVQSAHQLRLAAIICALAAVELAPPAWPVFRAHTNPYYAQLANRRGAVIDLPPRTENSDPLLAQMVHGLPIMGGYVSRIPDYRFVYTVPVVRDLWDMKIGDRTLIPSHSDDTLVVLNSYGLRTIVIHWPKISARQRASLRTVLAQVLPGATPIFQDAELAVYATPAVTPRPFSYFSEGWYGEEAADDRRWRWMGKTGTIMLVNPTNRPVAVTLTLTAHGYADSRDVDLTLNRSPLGRWMVGSANTTTSFRLLLRPGNSLLELRATPIRESAPTQRMLSIVIIAARMQSAVDQ